MMRLFSVSGFLSLFLGTLATLFTFQAGLIPFALVCSMAGFIASVSHIFIGTRLEMKMGIINRGTVGMLFCSVPVLVLLYFIFFRY